MKFIANWSSVLLLGVAVTAANGQDVSNALRECVREKNDVKRLACYDRVAGKTADGPPIAHAPPKVETSPQPQPKSAPSNPPPAVSENAESTFGLSAEQMTKPKTSAPLKQINGKVAKIETRARGRLVVTLDNEQVWEQLNPDALFSLHVGDVVTIKSGALGAYYLYGPSNRTTNVRRSQ